jgi:hypothetical protein
MSNLARSQPKKKVVLVLSETRFGKIAIAYRVTKLYQGRKLIGFHLVHQNGNTYLIDCQEPDTWWACSCFDFHVSQSECYHAKILRKHFNMKRRLG